MTVQKTIDYEALETRRRERLLDHVRGVMADGHWWTLDELVAELQQRGVKAQSPSVSARIRELPHDKRQRVKNLWEYRLI